MHEGHATPLKIWCEFARMTRERLNSSHSYQTRHGGNIRHPTCRLAKMTKSFLCNGVKLYNKLDKELREMNGDMFKRKLKSILTKKSYYNMSQALNDDFIA